MSDYALAAPADSRRASRRALPGVPSWTRLLGVTTVPVDPHDPHGPQGWVISAGVGTGHIAVLFHTSSDVDRPDGH
jgi:hypothetical protein